MVQIGGKIHVWWKVSEWKIVDYILARDSGYFQFTCTDTCFYIIKNLTVYYMVGRDLFITRKEL